MSWQEGAIEDVAKALDKNWNPDRYPVMAAMFRDYAATAVEALTPVVARAQADAWSAGWDLGMSEGIAYQAGQDEAFLNPTNPYTRGEP